VVAGIDTEEDEPGYKHSRIQPHIGGDLGFASASLQTYYGRLSSSWRTEGNNVSMLVEVPVNTKATVFIPAASPEAITEDGKVLSSIKEIQLGATRDGYVQAELGSGLYHFNIKK
jgi:alpha-L-rhamnosidase